MGILDRFLKQTYTESIIEIDYQDNLVGQFIYFQF